MFSFVRVKYQVRDLLIMNKTVLKVDGMMCDVCKGKVTDGLSSVEGVQSVDVDVRKGTATVEHEAGVSDEDLLMAVIDAGYKAKVKHGLFK